MDAPRARISSPGSTIGVSSVPTAWRNPSVTMFASAADEAEDRRVRRDHRDQQPGGEHDPAGRRPGDRRRDDPGQREPLAQQVGELAGLRVDARSARGSAPWAESAARPSEPHGGFVRGRVRRVGTGGGVSAAARAAGELGVAGGRRVGGRRGGSARGGRGRGRGLVGGRDVAGLRRRARAAGWPGDGPRRRRRVAPRRRSACGVGVDARAVAAPRRLGVAGGRACPRAASVCRGRAGCPRAASVCRGRRDRDRRRGVAARAAVRGRRVLGGSAGRGGGASALRAAPVAARRRLSGRGRRADSSRRAVGGASRRRRRPQPAVPAAAEMQRRAGARGAAGVAASPRPRDSSPRAGSSPGGASSLRAASSAAAIPRFAARPRWAAARHRPGLVRGASAPAASSRAAALRRARAPPRVASCFPRRPVASPRHRACPPRAATRDLRFVRPRELMELVLAGAAGRAEARPCADSLAAVRAEDRLAQVVPGCLRRGQWVSLGADGRAGMDGSPGPGGRPGGRGRRSPCACRADADADAAALRTGAPKILLAFDASGSMLTDDGNGTPQDRRRQGRGGRRCWSTLPDSTELGLRVYGGTLPSRPIGAACRDSKLVLPIGPRGPRPRQAEQQIRSFKGARAHPDRLRARAGRDRTSATAARARSCSSPTARTRASRPRRAPSRERIAKGGVEMRIQAIGFNVDPEARRELECIASAGGGVYRDATDAASCGRSCASSPRARCVSTSPKGKPIKGGPSARQATADHPRPLRRPAAPGLRALVRRRPRARRDAEGEPSIHPARAATSATSAGARLAVSTSSRRRSTSRHQQNSSRRQRTPVLTPRLRRADRRRLAPDRRRRPGRRRTRRSPSPAATTSSSRSRTPPTRRSTTPPAASRTTSEMAIEVLGRRPATRRRPSARRDRRDPPGQPDEPPSAALLTGVGGGLAGPGSRGGAVVLWRRRR